MALSQPSAPPMSLTLADYPFQCICADYFHYKGINYLVIVDRYSNWLVVENARDGSSGLINSLRHYFITYGMPNELSSDGDPDFAAAATRQFLSTCSPPPQISSIAHPQSNCRAEVGVMITDNTGPHGELDTNFNVPSYSTGTAMIETPNFNPPCASLVDLPKTSSQSYQVDIIHTQPGRRWDRTGKVTGTPT